MDRIFLDAKVLYSAAYLASSGLARLWSLKDVELVSSAYAVEEARRNLAIDRPEALQRLTHLTEALSTVDTPNLRLDPKDQPILMAAIHGMTDYLLTGDANHFDHLYGRRIEGALLLRLAQYFECRRA